MKEEIKKIEHVPKWVYDYMKKEKQRKKLLKKKGKINREIKNLQKILFIAIDPSFVNKHIEAKKEIIDNLEKEIQNL